MEVRLIPIDRIVEDTGQPRSHTDEEALTELADSIRRHGILNPITVVPLHNVGMYRIVTGERRWRAAAVAGLTEVPCIVRELETEEIRTQQLIENMQREDLSPLERARGIVALQDATGATVRDVAAMLGVSERTVNNLLDLLELPSDIGEQIVSSPSRPADGRLTEKHARFIKQLADDPERQRRVAERVREDRLSSAETASLVRALRESPELSEEILTAPPEAFEGYLKAKERAAAQRAAAAADQQAADVVRACMAALNEIRPVGLTPQGIADLLTAFAEIRSVLDALERECRLEMETSSGS
jgi:ParB family chromosome partitioning protein